ncbi:unnamed protein product [Gongylonema pulchrum]|uniref:MFS domain-containing protein n=1 Tax=Gongylonema pulchrum TaxID=637853 RepID=A0A183D516_9BILA|nr:unnamed protein product [Gongylonema pulchrum]
MNGSGDPTIRIIVAFTRYACLLAAAMCTEVFVLNAVQPSELFPTPVRSAGIAFIQIFNRLGTIVSPLVFIPVSITSKHWPPAPFLLMLLTSTTDFLLYFFLIPETRGKKLPDHMPGETDSASENRSTSTTVTKGGDTKETNKESKQETNKETGKETKDESRNTGSKGESNEGDKKSKEGEKREK